MIEVKELCKAYKNKKSGDLKVLKNISLTLPSRGMVFILGKSGCGKSTFLNVLGGLDGFDCGDIVFDGKSMKNFTAKDMDNHRNNCVGFVFQENNLLDDYTVSRNIAVALELQGQKQTEERTLSALRDVELEDFAARKCNTLSGGQKQRVAIARAIVKNPKILLCDEPTGSLDSETGTDIFSLLKKIGENTLVVVVSHDRESAEKYGDRVVELKDGVIISDSGKAVAENPKTDYAETSKRSLPAKRVFGLGAGLLIARPVRLCISLLICFIALMCLAFADSMSMYNKADAIIETMKLYNSSHISFTKSIHKDINSSLRNSYSMSEKDFEQLKSAVSCDRLDKVYLLRPGIYSKEYFEEYVEDGIYGSAYYGAIETDEQLIRDYGFNLYGKLPQDYDEVALPLNLFKMFKKLGYRKYSDDYNKNEIEAISDYVDLIGKTLHIKLNNRRSVDFKVTGILNTKLNENMYGDYFYNDKYISWEFSKRMGDIAEYGMHNVLYVVHGFYENVILPDNSEDLIIHNAVAPFKGSKKQLVSSADVENIKFDFDGKESYHTFRINNDATATLYEPDDAMFMITPIFLWASLGMVVISSLFVLYYSSGVVAEKKKDMGILRALGASRADIIKIFVAGNGIFAAAVIAVSTLLSFFAVMTGNKIFSSAMGVPVALISFSFRQFLILAAVAALAIIAGIAIPLIKLLRSKPVDIIAGRK